MTDQFEPDNLDEQIQPEYENPTLRWVQAPLLSRADMLIAIQQGKTLDGRATNLFRNALGREPRSDLLGDYLWPNLHRPGSHYVYVTPDPSVFRYTNWRPEMTRKVVDEFRSIALCGLFSNTLAWIDDADLSPSERTYNAGFAVYTIEFDGMLINDQMKIIYSGALKRIDGQFRRYHDYRGYEIVYSGGKSLHFHFCFDLRHLKRELATASNSSYRDNWTRDLPDCLLRPAYSILWDRLAQRFREVAQVEFEPDTRLRSWEQLRRCPWAFRLVNGAHPLGLPSGYLVRQPVLASSIFRHTDQHATEWFHNPIELGESCRPEAVRKSTPVLKLDYTFKSRELEVFQQHAPDMFRQIIGAEYPKFAGFEINRRGVRTYFYNGPGDQKPSSLCEGDRSRILLQGRHGFDTGGITLPATPNQIFNWVIAQFGNAAETPDDWVTRRYKAAVVDRASLARFVDEYLVEMTAPPPGTVRPAWIEQLFGRDDIYNSHVLIRGPQGCGKSTKLMSKIPTIYENDPGVIFFSSPSIEQTQEKIETFKRVNQDQRYVPFLYLSLTALYERFCPASDRISHTRVLEQGGSSWLHEVHKSQPDVYEQMYAYRSRLFGLRDEGKLPVLFGTHETMRQHAQEGATRVFYSPGFSHQWFEPMSLAERDNYRRRLIYGNGIHRVIVDEVTAHDLVSLHPYRIVEWANECAEKIESSKIHDIAERFAKFQDYLFAHPCTCKDMSWDLFNEVIACGYTDEDVVAVSDREIPFDETNPTGIYRKMVGQRYYVGLRGWWNQFSRVLMLTTEAVPTRILETIDREAASREDLQHDRFKIWEFGLPNSSRDTVTIELHRGCKKASLPDLIRAYRNRFPDAEIISDMAKKRISEFNVTTHMSAKGSNEFIHKDMISFYTNVSPLLFGELGALNTKFGRSDIVRLFYLDQFEQTCGRNRGYRAQHDCDHKAVLPPRLYAWLALVLSGASYVGVQCEASLG